MLLITSRDKKDCDGKTNRDEAQMSVLANFFCAGGKVVFTYSYQLDETCPSTLS